MKIKHDVIISWKFWNDLDNKIKSNMEFAKYSTRIVILFNKSVIKIPISKRGYLQGKHEKYIWDKYGHKKLLAPLIWEKWGIVKQKKCDAPNKWINHKYIYEVKLQMPEFNFDGCDLHNYRNWGYYNGRVVLIGYGINEKISKMY